MYIPKIDFSKNVVWQIANPWYILKLWKILHAYYPGHTSTPNTNRPQNRSMIDILSIRVNIFPSFGLCSVQSCRVSRLSIHALPLNNSKATDLGPIILFVWFKVSLASVLQCAWVISQSPCQNRLLYRTFDRQNFGLLKYCFFNTIAKIFNIYQPSKISIALSIATIRNVRMWQWHIHVT